jgi:hypothetical protein
MRDVIAKRIAELTNEIQSLHNERESMMARDREIDVRLHQLVGAVYEMQQLIQHPDHQPSDDLGDDPSLGLLKDAQSLQSQT